MSGSLVCLACGAKKTKTQLWRRVLFGDVRAELEAPREALFAETHRTPSSTAGITEMCEYFVTDIARCA